MTNRGVRFWHHHINEPPRGSLIWHPRLFWHFARRVDEIDPRAEEREYLGGHLEFALSKPKPEASVSLSVGTRGSETPFDGHIGIAGTTLYWGINQGSRLADRIGQRWLNRLPDRYPQECLDNTCDCPPYNPAGSNPTFKRHINTSYHNRYDARRLDVHIHDGSLWWEFWTFDGHWTRDQFARWRSGHRELNPLTWLYGSPRYWYEDRDEREILVHMPEADYPVTATLQLQTFGRPKLPNRRRATWIVDVKADQCRGIPYRYDESGGYKGDRVWGFAVLLGEEHRRDWWVDAKAAIESRILSDRARTGFRKPLPLEDHPTKSYEG